MFFLLVIILIVLFFIFYVLHYMQQKLFIIAAINDIGILQTYLRIGLSVCLFVVISLVGYFAKGNFTKINYSYNVQQQKNKQYFEQLIKIAAQEIAIKDYKNAEQNYKTLLLCGIEQSNVLVGYVIAQLGQNIYHINEDKTLLNKAIKINPKDFYPRLLLNNIINLHETK